MASPQRPKGKKPNSPIVRKENKCEEDPPSAVKKPTPLPKPTKKSFMSPTFSASSKTKKVLSERNDPSPFIGMRPSCFTEDDIFGRRQEERTTTRAREPPSLEELQRKVQKLLEDHTTQYKGENPEVNKQPSPYHPFCSPFSAASDSDFGTSSKIRDEKEQSELPPYDPKTNYVSPRPQFLRYRPDRNLDLLLHGESPRRPFVEEQKEEFGGVNEVHVGFEGLRKHEPQFEGFVDNKGFRESEFQEGNELESLRRKISLIDLTRENSESEDKGRSEGEASEERQQHPHGVFAEEAVFGSCVSREPVIGEKAVPKPSVSAFEPKWKVVGEAEDGHGGMKERPRCGAFIKNGLLLMLTVLFASLALLASGSPGLLPSSLVDNPLATAWHSSKLYKPTLEALSGVRGFWKQGIVQPMYFDINLQAPQRQHFGLTVRGNGLWVYAKELCLETFKKVGLNMKKLQESCESKLNALFSGLYKSSDIEDSAIAVELHEENPFYANEELDKMFSFEDDGTESIHLEESSYEDFALSPEVEMEGQTEIFDRSISSLEIQSPEDSNAWTVEFDIFYEEAENYSRNHDNMEVPSGAEDGPVLMADILDYEQVTEKVSADAKIDTLAWNDNVLDFVPIHESMIDSANECEPDYGIYDSYEIDSSPEAEINSELHCFGTDSEVEPFDTFFIEGPMELGMSINEDLKESDMSFKEDPEELSSSINENEAHDPVVIKQFGTPELKSPDELDFHYPVLVGKSEMLDLDSRNEIGVVISGVEKSNEGVSDILVAEDFNDLRTLSTSTEGKSLKSLLLYGITGTFVFAAAAALSACIANWYRKSARYISPKTSPESAQEVQTKSNYLTQDDHLTLSSKERLCSQIHYPNSVQARTPSETLYERRGASVPSVQLLNEYSPSEVVSSSDKRLDTTWTSSAQGNSFYTPERQVRRKANALSVTDQGTLTAPEISMDDSSYGSFTTLIKEGVDNEQAKVTPVRRSGRIRNQAKSPPRSPTSRRQKPLN